MYYDSIYSIATQGMHAEKQRINRVAHNIANQYSIQVSTQATPPNKIYQPNHPLADQQGYITYPGINTLHEMSTLLKASRAYEADIKIMNTAHHLYLQTLRIGEER